MKIKIKNSNKNIECYHCRKIIENKSNLIVSIDRISFIIKPYHQGCLKIVNAGQFIPKKFQLNNNVSNILTIMFIFYFILGFISHQKHIFVFGIVLLLLPLARLYSWLKYEIKFKLK